MWLRKSLELFRRHLAAIVLALFAALLVGGPSALSPRAIGESYQGVPFLYQDSEWAYLARIHDVLDGHPALGSPVFYEYKNVPSLLPPMGEYEYAAIKLATFLPLNAVVLGSKFAFPFALFLLAYCAAFLLGEKGRFPRLAGLASASATLFGLDFVNPPYALSIMRAGSSELYLSVWSRLVNPISGALLTFAFICALSLSLRGKRRAWIPLGIALGLMSGYVFSFALSLTALSIVCAALFFQKRRRAAIRCAAAAAVAFLVNAFQLPAFFSLLRSPDARAFSLRNGLLLTHAPLLDKSLLVASALFAALYVACRRRASALSEASDSFLVLSSFLLAAFIVMNQQVLTGETVWPQHFVQYAVPISYLALAVAASVSLTKTSSRVLSRALQLLFFVIIAGSFAFGARTFDSYKSALPDFADEERMGPAMRWLSADAPRDCVVFAVESENRLSNAVPALTQCDDYWSSYVFSGIPESRIEHNYLMRLRFAGVTALEAPAYISGHQEEYRSVMFADWKEQFWYTDDPWLISISDRAAIQARFDALEKKLAADYATELQGDFLSELKEYKLDYVIWDSEKYPDWNPAAFPFLKETYAQEGIHVYAAER